MKKPNQMPLNWLEIENQLNFKPPMNNVKDYGMISSNYILFRGDSIIFTLSINS